jgi:hypothetical protein
MEVNMRVILHKHDPLDFIFEGLWEGFLENKLITRFVHFSCNYFELLPLEYKQPKHCVIKHWDGILTRWELE